MKSFRFLTPVITKFRLYTSETWLGKSQPVSLFSQRTTNRVLHGLMENTPAKPQYILAVEQTPTTLSQFVKTLSKVLSDNKVTNIIAEEAFLYKNMTVKFFGHT